MAYSFPKNIKTTLNGTTLVAEMLASDVIQCAIDLVEKDHLSFQCMTATDERATEKGFKLWYIFGDAKKHSFVVLTTLLCDTTSFPSLSPFIHSAWNYERRVQTFFGLTPVGHPDTRPIILHENWPENLFPLRKDFDYTTRPKMVSGKYDFQKVAGEGIYEIPVGPIHAGIIEPGHFRFSVAGESIVVLEARLGFTHKGSEKLFEVLSIDDQIRLSEKISGDSSFSHSLAFCQALEDLGAIPVPERALMLRAVYAELERLANHFGDIGAMMMDTGFNFGGAHGARLREHVLRLNEQLTGSRFLRGVNTLGGVMKDITLEQQYSLKDELTSLEKDFSEIIDVAENSTSLLNRMRETGTLTNEMAIDMNILGVAGRASGISQDVRRDYPYALYHQVKLDEIPVESDGDVLARFHVRVREVYASLHCIVSLLDTHSAGAIRAEVPESPVFRKNAFALSAVEGWRGEILYFVTTNTSGKISRVFPRDPSFVNWSALRSAGFDNVVPDFPLINKSFNLSYTGNDL